MVSYHTPKVYRSPFGCCICRAKSSSSRFTDSSRYEDDFVECFKLEEPRYGEICNACVLLIKRWKKLPPGNNRNWHHVVDARARPRGRATITKVERTRNVSPDLATLDKSSHRMKKHRYVPNVVREWSPTESEDQGFAEDRLSEVSATSVPNSRVPSPSPSPHPSEDVLPPRFGSSKRKQTQPLRAKYKEHGEFIDSDYWKKEKVCCGFIFKGRCGEVLVDTRLFKPCCPVDVEAQVSSPGRSEVAGSSFGVMSDGGSFYEDEGLESLDEEALSVDDFYTSSMPDRDAEANLLSELAAALIT